MSVHRIADGQRRFDGKVALVTGAARGQGRSHAVALAAEGASIVATDICANIDTVPYDLATPQDLDYTAQLVEQAGAAVIVRRADVRSAADMAAVAVAALEEFGQIDIVIANAGVQSFASAWELTEQQWRDVIDVDLTGVWHTFRSAVPSMIDAGRGGCLIATSSFAGKNAIPNLAHYTAAKHGVTGLAQAFAVELAQYSIRSNSLHPATVNSPMIDNESFIEFFMGTTGGSLTDIEPAMRTLLALPVPWIEIDDITNAVLFLASEAARYITGVGLPIDAGGQLPFRIPNQTQNL